MYDTKIIISECAKLYDSLGDKVLSLRDKTVLVTGSNGLLGGFFSDFFVYLNDFHNFNIKIQLTSLSKREDATRILHLLNRSDVSYRSCDLSKAIDEYCFEKSDFIFFMSGYGQPKKFIDNKMKTIMINTIGLDSVIRHAAKKNAKILFSSTSEIYGDPDVENIPTSENYNGNYSVESNRACYISSKRLGEVICLEHKKDNPDLDIKIARIALSYGPGVFLNDDRVLQDFIVKGAKNGVIKLFDAGAAIRNYMFITDSAKVIFDITFKGKETIYNVGGNTEEITIYELAKIVGNVINVPVEKGSTHQEFVSKSPSRVALDMSRYEREFGKNENVTQLSDGIEKTAKWLGIIN
jgi:dTDP-glucose 4,6-dehydratase/UDP-glucuronate decarboxylase